MTASITGVIGGSTTLTHTDADRLHGLGNVACGDNGSEHIYVQANGALTAGMFVAIDENFQADALTKALADEGHRIGVVQTAFADNDYGWAAVKGSVDGSVLASCAADINLYTSATAGSLDDTSTSQTLIDGVVTTATNGGSTAAVSCVLSNPRAATF